MIDLYPKKAQYLKGEPVKLVVEIPIHEDIVKAQVDIFHLDKLVRTESAAIIKQTDCLDVGAFYDDFAGYGVEVTFFRSDGTKLYAATAFDVTNLTKKSLRYGFLSDFTAEDDNDKAIDSLLKYHINMVQFYDWSYRHDNLVAKEEAYTDMMGKNIHLQTVKNKIQKAKSYGMKPMAYGAIYAASHEFYKEHPDWAFYTGTKEVFKFIDTFYIMNIEKNSPWHAYIINQYKEAVEKVGFLGIHMDTYGFPKTAYSHYNGECKRIKLEEEFAELIKDTKSRLLDVEKENCLVFNNVGNWPVTSVADSKVDAVYIEVWNPYDRYFHIKQIIEGAKNACHNAKPVILAAYLAPFRTESMEQASYSAYILTAVIVANGSYHLLLGEENAVLTQGYYGDYTKLLPEQVSVLRKYYDFMIRYMNLFYAPDMIDVSMTHLGWDNYEYQCSFQNWSAWGEADKIWITLKENDAYKCIHLINLCGCKEDYWNKGKEKPTEQQNLLFCIHVDSKIQGITYASPDSGNGKSIALEYQYQYTDKGRFVTFTVPKLQIWSLVYITL